MIVEAAGVGVNFQVRLRFTDGYGHYSENYATDEITTSIAVERTGYTTFNFGSATSPSLSVLELPSGKFLVGSTSGNNIDTTQTKITRWNSNGTLDTSFGTSGILTIPFSSGSQWDEVNVLHLLEDGSILLSGYFYRLDGVGTFGMVKLTSSFVIDTSFGTSGYVSLSFDNGLDVIQDVVEMSDNKLVACGYSWNSTFSTLSFVLAKFNSNGSLDTSFGTSGKVITDFGITYEQALSMDLQDDGKIVVAGYTNQGETVYSIPVARYNSDGSLDTSFSGDGKLLLNDVGNTYIGGCSHIQSDGKIIIGGGYNVDIATGISEGQLLVRLNTNGSLDTSFGVSGVVETGLVDGVVPQNVNYVEVQNTGKILALSSSKHGGDPFCMVRYNLNGSVDTSFGTSGVFKWLFDGNFMHVYNVNGVLSLSDNSIVITGSWGTDNNALQSFLLKVTSSGEFDTNFGDEV